MLLSVPTEPRVTITGRDVAAARAAWWRAIRAGASEDRVRMLHLDIQQLRLAQAMQAFEAIEGDLGTCLPEAG